MPGIDSFTKLMLHMDGTDASTTFTDSSLSPHTMTAVGNAQIDTAQSYFNGASGLFDGTGDWLTAVDSADWSFGAGDFTVDCWVRQNSAGSYQPGACGQFQNGTNFWTMYWFPNNGTPKNAMSVIFEVGGVVKGRYNVSTDMVMEVGVWHHYAWVRSGTNFYMFQDGISQSLTTTTAISTNDVGDITATLHVADDGQGETLNGWMDEFRISKGIARWTSNFTPPNRPYSISSGDLALSGVG